MKLTSFFPPLPHTDRPGRTLSSTAESWSWTEHDDLSSPHSLCYFATSCSAQLQAQDGSSASPVDKMTDWNGILPSPPSSIAILASMPFGCVLHAAADHVLNDPASKPVLLLTTASKDAVRSNLATPEQGGTPMAWVACATAPSLKHALEKVELVHITSIEELVAFIVHLASQSESGRPSALICEGLSHILQDVDVRQFTYVMSLLHGIATHSHAERPDGTQLILIDNALDTLRPPICPSLHHCRTPLPSSPTTSSTEEADRRLLPPPAQEHLQEVSCLPILLNRFGWVATMAEPKADAPKVSGQAGQGFRLFIQPGHMNALKRRLQQSSSGGAATDDSQKEETEGKGKGELVLRQYIIDVQVKWT
ncbi:hypothetical protein OC834_000907 [Tilletia horrida]|nr:hypothetical protein OC834_000907 [Tilletia horrida]